MLGKSKTRPNDRIERNKALCRVGVQILFTLYLFFLFFFHYTEDWNFLYFLAFVFAIFLEKHDPSEGHARKFRNIFVSLLVLFAFLNFISAMFPVDVEGMEFSNRNNYHFYGSVIAIGLGLGLRTADSVKRMLVVLLIVTGVWYLWEFIKLFFGSSFSDGRFVGIWGYNANTTAILLIVLFSLYFGLVFTARKRSLVMFSACGALVTGTLLFLTKSRFALLTMIFITVPAALFFQRRFFSLRSRIISAVIIICLVAPLSSFMWWSHADPGRKSFGTAVYRFATFQDAISIYNYSEDTRKIFGSGSITNVYPIMLDYFSIGSLITKRLPHAHNVPLQTLLETGVVGVINLVLIWFLAFAGLIRIWWQRSFKDNDFSVPLLVALLTMAAVSQMDYSLWSICGMVSWFVLGLSYAYIRVILAHNIEGESFH